MSRNDFNTAVKRYTGNHPVQGRGGPAAYISYRSKSESFGCMLWNPHGPLQAASLPSLILYLS
jgi:hypothetical protein